MASRSTTISAKIFTQWMLLDGVGSIENLTFGIVGHRLKVNEAASDT